MGWNSDHFFFKTFFFFIGFSSIQNWIFSKWIFSQLILQNGFFQKWIFSKWAWADNSAPTSVEVENVGCAYLCLLLAMCVCLLRGMQCVCAEWLGVLNEGKSNQKKKLFWKKCSQLDPNKSFTHGFNPIFEKSILRQSNFEYREIVY